jgi:plasmid stabilization system protein ParE
MGWKVIIAPSARADLESIVRFIARENRDAAARIGYELIVRAEGLAAFPEMGRVVPEFKQPDLREIVCRSYRIIHRLRREQQRIEIVRFWHGSRGLPRIPHGDQP